MSTVDTSNYNTVLELKTLKILSDLAKNLKKKSGVENQFASAVVNANIAEYVLYLLILIFSNEIKKTCDSQKSKVTLLEIDPSGKLNNNKLTILKYFEFKNKFEIINLLSKILKNRDNIFHNLIRAQAKKINIDKEIEEIHLNTDELRKLVAQTFDDVWMKN